MTERLTTLSQVKDWLGIDNDNSDSSLSRLIDAASQHTLNYLDRQGFGAADHTQNFSGNGKTGMLLRNWPVLSIESVGVGGRLIPEATLGVGGLPSRGYRISDPRNAPQSIDLHGYRFDYRCPCQVIYRAGFESSQSFTLVDTDGSVTAQPSLGGQWVSDKGVTLDGTDASAVEGDPSSGEYSVIEGLYTFNTSDAGKEAIISYVYVPTTVSFAVTEMIGEWYARKDRIGVLSKTLGGQETVTFSDKDMNESIRSSLQHYRNVIPV